MSTRFCLGIMLACLSAVPAVAQAPPDQAMFARDRILDIRIVMTEADWREIRLSHPNGDESGVNRTNDDGYRQKPAELWIDGVRVGRVGVRKKGTFGSVVSTRPSLKIKLDEYVPKQAYGGMDDLTLNNNVQDATLVNQVLSYDFFTRAGVPAPRANFASVRVNDEHLGVYTHVEGITKTFLRRAFGSDAGALFESYTGDFTADRLSRIVEKRGVRPEHRQALERLRDLLAAPGLLSLPAIDAIVDVQSFIRFWAAESLLGHWDGYSGNRNNYYLYASPTDGRLRFIPWGADQVFIDPAGAAAALNPPKQVKAVGILAQRLWEVPEVRQRYQVALRELLAGPWDEPRMLADMTTIQLRLQPMSVLTEAMTAQASERVRMFLAGRRADVMAELAGPTPAWPTSNAPVNVPYVITGSFTAPWSTIAPENPSAVGDARVRLQVGGQDVDFTSVGAYALTNLPPSARATYPGVVLTAVSGTHTWRITLSIDPMIFGVGTVPVDQYQGRAQVSLLEDGKRARNQNLLNRGELTFEEANASEGGVLRGTFTLRGVAP